MLWKSLGRVLSTSRHLRCFSTSQGALYTNGYSEKCQERTFVMIKPDGVQRCLVGPIVAKIQSKGYKLVAMKLFHAPLSTCEEHYNEHRQKKYFQVLIQYIRSGPVVPMVFEGERCVESLRSMIGHKDPVQATPGTIRGDWGITVARNVIHASDSLESAQREIKLWFNDSELVDWTTCDNDWLYEPTGL